MITQTTEKIMSTVQGMTSRERVRAIIAGEPADRSAFWLGMPAGDAWPAIHDHFGTTENEELCQKLGDDFRWICAGFGNFSIDKEAHGDAGPFAEVEDVAAVEDYPWPETSAAEFPFWAGSIPRTCWSMPLPRRSAPT